MKGYAVSMHMSLYPAQSEIELNKKARAAVHGEGRRPEIGIVVAKPEEYAALQTVFGLKVDNGSEGEYPWFEFATVKKKSGGSLSVVIMLLAGQGNDFGADGAAILLERYRTVKQIILIGIAAGVPHPERLEDHVRLGDVVVSDQYGVVQYDYIKKTSDEVIFRASPRPPCAKLLKAARLLKASEIRGRHPWLEFIQGASHELNVDRPPESTDILVKGVERISHPNDPIRKEGCPRVFLGTIASANILLKDACFRDQLRDKFGVKAIEMEAAGVADATWSCGASYLIVRGISDYADPNKNDLWQPYAQIAAAAYVRALLESLPSQPVNISRTDRRFWIPAIALFVGVCFSSMAYLTTRYRRQGAGQASPTLSGPSLTSNRTTSSYQIFVESKKLPVRVYCDGSYLKTLDSASPFTTIEVREGEHEITARSGVFSHEERVRVSQQNPVATVLVADIGKTE